MAVTIYHRPQCSTSRAALELICSRGIEPTIVLYAKTGWTQTQLASLFEAMKVTPRDMLRVKGTPAQDLGLTDPAVSDARILAAMVENPILVERPIVTSSKGAVLARPVERVLDIL
ncbi:arsenate reductase (glutaredoxin) [Asticcacaulis sp. 201]|uniref:arsenate reductase (glutaredoxin) n=1 Tax=Asticcacaulis sp. 201 TaxID=3028787 RepID=UPI002916D76C|nr:arsenate reductase (glutaredoxin) [Asticcacaulis sp. 201]MDV6331862.1 arsenate reductase (glutaredoxin) [Asticcacaulis sp. 201]